MRFLYYFWMFLSASAGALLIGLCVEGISPEAIPAFAGLSLDWPMGILLTFTVVGYFFYAHKADKSRKNRQR